MDEFFEKKVCDRCGCPLHARILSRMNTDTLCLPCRDEEQQHPLYAKAAAAELSEVQRKNYNYPGLFDGQVYPFETALKNAGLKYEKSESKTE